MYLPAFADSQQQYEQLMQRLAPYQETIAFMEQECLGEDVLDPKLLTAYYQLHVMRKAHPALASLEKAIDDRRGVDAHDEALDLVVPYNRLVDAIEEFDNALMDFRQVEAREEDYEVDAEEEEDVLFDKIRSLRSSFRYYCEEVKKICDKVCIE